MGLTKDITAKYSKLDAWIYDTFIAEAVMGRFMSRFEIVSQQLLDKLPKGSQVLDVGCGGGQITLELAVEFPNLNFCGVDLSEEQVTRARRRTLNRSNVRFLAGNAMELPFPPDTFDALISIASLKHWPDKERGLRECLRILKLGGRLMVAEADRDCSHGEIADFISSWKIPPVLSPLAEYFFRRFVANRSVNLEEVILLCSKSLPQTTTVKKLPGLPAILLTADKPD